VPWKPSEPSERPSLGWLVLDWIEEYLIVPDGPSAGEALTFTNEQARFVLTLYEVDPTFAGSPIRGRALVNARLVRRAVLSRPKGWGKSPLVAAICLAEALCPVVLDGWDADGQPVGREWSSLGFKPKVQVVAASEDQTTNTWDPLLEMARNGPVIDAYDIEPMETFINIPRGVIEPTTSAGTSREGFRPVFSALDQTESWGSSNGGHKLAAAIRRNLGKVNGCSVETPNAFVPGRDTVAERSYDAFGKQAEGRTRIVTGLLYDHREAPPDTDPADEDSLRAGLRVSYGESLDTNGGWVTEDRIVAEYYDPDTDPQDARAYYLNQITHASDSWLSKQDWAKNADPARIVADGEAVTLFFDGSKSDDSTGLVGCRMSDGFVFTIEAWEKPEGPAGKGWQVDRVDVDRVVRATFDQYDVVAFLADVKEFESYVDEWGNAFGEPLLIDATTGKYRHPVAWDMRSKVPEFTAAAERALTDITEGEFPHDGDSRLYRHALNARRSPNKWGVSISKESRESPRKIDLMVCAIGARHARRLALASDAWQKRGTKKKPGRVIGWN
jgi:hypothetical protein